MLTKANEIITVSEGLAKELRCFHSNLNIYSGCISDVRMHFQENRTEERHLKFFSKNELRLVEIRSIYYLFLASVSEI